MTHRVLEALARAPRTQLALTDLQRSLDYGALAAAVDAQSRWLDQAGVRRCALLADNGTDWVIADLALLRLGALNVPVPAWFTPAQVAHVIDDAGIDAVLSDDPERVTRDHDAFTLVGMAPHSRLALLRRDRAAGSAAGLAKVTYTSGSTGTAKGVCLSLDAMEAVAGSLASVAPAGPARHLCTMPLATLLENVAGVYVPLLLGGTCIVPSSRTIGVSYGRLEVPALLETITRAAPHSLIIVPELLRILVAAARSWRPPASLDFIAVGGAPVSQELLDAAHAAGLPAYQGYGLSECASVVCLNTPAASRRGSVGRPLPHASVTVDAQGQLLVSGARMHGYLGGDAESGEYIATGDLGSIDQDGYVYVQGRLKNILITSMGRNISPEWVEAELLCSPFIAQAIVCGDSRPWLSALIAPSALASHPEQIAQAVAQANARLPDYAQVRAWAPLAQPLRFEDGLLTANGRPRRAAIAQRYSGAIEALYATALAS